MEPKKAVGSGRYNEHSECRRNIVSAGADFTQNMVALESSMSNFRQFELKSECSHSRICTSDMVKCWKLNTMTKRLDFSMWTREVY